MKEYIKGEKVSISDTKDCNLTDEGAETAKMTAEVREKALLRLTSLCMQGEHCKKDVMEKMEKWGIPDDLQEDILEYLIAERFVDEKRYCRSFIHDKLAYNKWGRRKIEQALWMKGIGKEIYAEAFEDIDEAQWREALEPLLRQKSTTTKGRNEYEKKQKLIRFALGRGFYMEDILEAMKVMNMDMDCDADSDDFA